MQAAHFTCPRCFRHLRTERPVAAGKRLRCPRCGTNFRAPMPDDRGRPARSGILLAWLLFAGAIVLVGGGLGLAVVVNNHAAHPEATANLARGEDAPRVVPPVLDVPSPPRDGPPPPAPPPAKTPDRAAPPPRRVEPPPLPKPPPPQEASRQAENRPAPAKVQTPPQPEKLHAPNKPRAEAPPIAWLPARMQKRVDQTVDRGIEFLRRQQHVDGTWGHLTAKVSQRFTPGVTALAALTMLECGVPARDPQVQAAAKYLRQRMPDITTTYSIAMTILFFDRLGETGDVPRLRTLAMRLIAGQKPSGGWDYYCPVLGEDEELGLLALLYQNRPTTPLDLFGKERIDLPSPDLVAAREPAKLDGELYKPRPSPIPPLDLFVARDPAARTESERKPPEAKPPEKAPAVTDKPSSPPEKPKAEDAGPTLPGDARRLTEKARAAAAHLSESLRQTPALNAGMLLRTYPDFVEPRTDNSNTQLAILGLLTAENYDIPIERTMVLLDWRFRNSLTEQLGWNYRPNWPTTPAMTAAALMGLSLKHGLLLPNSRDRGRNVRVRDPLIQRGFLTLDHLLDRYIEGVYAQRTKTAKLDLYCLWTVERVAVLYNLQRIGTIEWYPEGVKLLVPLQREDGSWGPGGTTCLEEPSVSTSFALLFCKRSNLARELTERLNAPDEK